MWLDGSRSRKDKSDWFSPSAQDQDWLDSYPTTPHLLCPPDQQLGNHPVCRSRIRMNWNERWGAGVTWTTGGNCKMIENMSSWITISGRFYIFSHYLTPYTMNPTNGLNYVTESYFENSTSQSASFNPEQVSLVRMNIPLVSWLQQRVKFPIISK